MFLGSMFRTGMRCHAGGIYAFAGYLDRAVTVTPTWEELSIPLDFGETFPPIKSTQAGCYWKYIGC